VRIIRPEMTEKDLKIIGVVTNSISPFCEVGRIPRNRQFSAKFGEILQFLHQRLPFINTLKIFLRIFPTIQTSVYRQLLTD